MPKANTLITDLLNHIFLNSAITKYGDATGLPAAATVGSLYISLHTADPGKAGDQTTNEANYTGYARVAVARSVGGWTVANPQVSNAALINFATCTAGSNTITHIGVGTDSSGAGKLLYYAPFSIANYGAFTAKASTDTVTIPGHSLSVNDTVMFYGAYNKTLPAGISSGTLYYVKTVSGNDITLSTTQGGATLDITADGDGDIYKITTLAVSVNIAPQIAAGQLVILED